MFRYRETPLKVFNNGHTIEIEYERGSWLQAGSRIFELVQFHFDTPSEHTLEDGARFPMELHLVHRDSQGSLAVVGLLVREGAANAALAPIWNDLPNEEGEVIEDREVEINAEDFLPTDVRAFHSSGSLTTPPCSENVRWFVVRQPIELSMEQIYAFQTALSESCCVRNARPTQSLGQRTIGRDILPAQR